MAKNIKVGDKVRWYDPEENARNLSIVWTVNEIQGDLSEEDTVILITNEYGSEAEVFQSELINLE